MVGKTTKYMSKNYIPNPLLFLDNNHYSKLDAGSEFFKK